MEPTSPILPEATPPAPARAFGPAEPDAWEPAAATPPAGEPAPEPAPRQSFFKRRIAPLGAAIVAFLAKIKSILLLLPQIKLLVTAGSMAVSIAAYATIWGFWFGVGIVLLLLVHEMGHVIALRREGIRASAPTFIPFLGAVITSRSLGGNALAEARVGLAGPILGSIGSAACLVIWHVTGHDYWRALAYFGFFINLFNLLPVVPLDGGRAMAAMSPWLWAIGLAGMVALVFVFHNPIILIFVVFAGYETYRRWQQLRGGRAPHGTALAAAGYYRVQPRDRLLVGAVYLSLVVLLVVGMHAANLPRTL